MFSILLSFGRPRLLKIIQKMFKAVLLCTIFPDFNVIHTYCVHSRQCPFLGSLDAHQLVELLQSQGVKVRLLDLKRGDIRPGLAELRNRGIQNFLVDIGAEFGVLKLFFDEVCTLKVNFTFFFQTFIIGVFDQIICT